jgi:AcrR family transcriptional regulator
VDEPTSTAPSTTAPSTTASSADAPADAPGGPSTPGLGLRERKKLRTQQELCDAALRLARERGFDHVTADDIAAEVDVSKTTFYRYFDSKEAALVGSASEKVGQLRAALDERPLDEPALTAVRNAVVSFIRSYEMDRETSLLRACVIRDNPSLLAHKLEMQAEWEGVIAEFVAGRSAAAPDVELRSRLVSAVVVATIRATLDYWRDTDGAEDASDLLDTALAMVAEERVGLVDP